MVSSALPDPLHHLHLPEPTLVSQEQHLVAHSAVLKRKNFRQCRVDCTSAAPFALWLLGSGSTALLPISEWFLENPASPLLIQHAQGILDHILSANCNPSSMHKISQAKDTSCASKTGAGVGSSIPGAATELCGEERTERALMHPQWSII